jgi:hypothetical protein
LALPSLRIVMTRRENRTQPDSGIAPGQGSIIWAPGIRPDDQPVGDERCGFDITPLHLATNLFSYLTPRDGSPPSTKTQRKARDRITCLPAIEPTYMRWWMTHWEELAEGAKMPPRPPWLTALRAETADPGRRR